MRTLSVLLLVALAVPARAESRSEAEDAWAALVETAAAGAKKGLVSAAGAPIRERVLTERTEIEELVDAIRRVEGALLTASERPKTDDLPGRLAASREALGIALMLGVRPGEVARVRVRVVDGASAWDSVTFGPRLYPLVSASLEFRFVVPAKWLPDAHPATPIAELPWACPRAKFERLPDGMPDKAPAPWRAYVEAVREFVDGALQAARKPAMPNQLVVVEPPELGHVFRPAAADGLPLTRTLIPIADWAGQPLTPRTTLPEMQQFRGLYDTIVHRDRARDILANCALIAQKLVLEPLAPQVDAAEKASMRALIAPYLHRTTQFELALADSAQPGAKEVGRLPRGTEVEILDGVTLEPGNPPRVRVGAMLKVQGGDLVGWIPSHRPMRWKVGGKPQEEPVPTLLDDVPDRRDELGVTLRELAGTYFVHLGNVERAKSDKSAREAGEAQALAQATLSRFCREKARYFEIFGPESFPDEIAAYRDQRNAARMPAAMIDREVAATFDDAGCGALEKP